MKAREARAESRAKYLELAVKLAVEEMAEIATHIIDAFDDSAEDAFSDLDLDEAEVISRPLRQVWYVLVCIFADLEVDT